MAVGHRLDGMVPVFGEHTTLEGADHLGTLAGRTDVLGGRGTHARNFRLAHVRVARAVLSADRNLLAGNNAGVSRAYMSMHLYSLLRKILGVALEKHFELHII